MAEFIHFAIPCYYTQTFKTKADKTFLVNLNWYRNAHHFIKNTVKKWFNDEVCRLLKEIDPDPIPGKYEMALEYYYKNKNSDLDNICSVASKHCNDALKDYGLVPDDKVDHCVKITYLVAEQDKDNPRVEVYIREFKEEDET